jgi:hypothetical protein
MPLNTPLSHFTAAIGALDFSLAFLIFDLFLCQGLSTTFSSFTHQTHSPALL